MLRFAVEPGKGHFIYPYVVRLDAPVLSCASAEVVRQWCGPDDTLVVDWANELARDLSTLKKDFRLVVRVHDHEIFRGKVDVVDWEGVDRIWFINSQFQEAFLERFPEQADKSFYLPNAVLPEQFSERSVTAKRIGFLARFLRGRKRFDRAVRLFRLLHTLEPEWELVVRTLPAENRKRLRRLRGMLRGLPVRFVTAADKADNIQGKEDISSFFGDMAVVLNTSDHEGFCYAVAEGALCGCLPVVWDWPSGGAERFWGPFVAHNAFQAVRAILSYQPSGGYRRYVEDHFSADVLVPQLLEEIGQPGFVPANGSQQPAREGEQ